MQVAYARTPLQKSIFLAGPTPRSDDVQSWRPEALELLSRHKFDGTVYVPEDSKQSWSYSYDDQIEWELEALSASTVILFWIPRDACLPGFTTNCEYAYFIKQRNLVLGYPRSASKMKYLRGLAALHNVKAFSSLEATVKAAIELTARPFPTTVEREYYDESEPK